MWPNALCSILLLNCLRYTWTATFLPKKILPYFCPELKETTENKEVYAAYYVHKNTKRKGYLFSNFHSKELLADQSFTS